MGGEKDESCSAYPITIGFNPSDIILLLLILPPSQIVTRKKIAPSPAQNDLIDVSSWDTTILIQLLPNYWLNISPVPRQPTRPTNPTHREMINSENREIEIGTREYKNS